MEKELHLNNAVLRIEAVEDGESPLKLDLTCNVDDTSIAVTLERFKLIQLKAVVDCALNLGFSTKLDELSNEMEDKVSKWQLT